jgi:hypothetical protein
MTNKNSVNVLQIQYWHLLAFYVQINDNIDKNNKIGYVGNTGLSTEQHLTVYFPNRDKDLKVIYIKNKMQ